VAVRRCLQSELAAAYTGCDGRLKMELVALPTVFWPYNVASLE
jgi:hypothetical protein